MSPELRLEGHVVRPAYSAGTSSPATLPTVTHALTLLLALLASNMLALARADGEYPAAWWIERGVELSLVLAAAIWLRRRAAQGGVVPAISPVLLAIVVLSLLWEPCQRWLLATGRPFEILVMDGLRLMVLGLAAASCWSGYQRLAAGASLFLVMFGAMLSFTRLVHVLVGVYATAALGWLAATYWDTLRARLIASHRRQQPRWGVIALVAVLGTGVVSVGASNRSAIVVLGGFMPSSGGNRWNDPQARSGVGDGDLLVAGVQNIQSFAPIEDAPFVDDHLPSLYDVVNEVSGEPRQISTRNGLRVAVPQEFAAKLKQHLHTRSEQAAREFSTLRRAVQPRQRTIKDIHSDALLYVAGRTPLHLRMQTYALFDGVDWLPEPLPETHRLPELRIVEIGGRPWLQLDDKRRWADYLASAETHAVKPVRLGSKVIPAPLHLHGVHIDRVDRPEFFAWGAGGLVTMRRDEIPSGVAIHLASRAVDLSRLELDLPGGRFLKMHAEYEWIPASMDVDRLRSTALDWTAGKPFGWPQVQAVVDRLRQDYVLDREIVLGDDEHSSVEEFLFVARRGPDYLFATAAALLLRSLGYSTRLVSGFYVDPQKYNVPLRHTPVLKEDLHFWVEVHVTAEEWLTVEPTPGYQVLGPPPDLGDRIWTVLLTALEFVHTHIVSLGAILLAMAGLWLYRVTILDGGWTMWWHTGRRGRLRAQVLAAWKLIERRLRWNGCERPAGLTVRDWVQRLEASNVPAAGDLRQYLDLLDWAVFAPADICPPVSDPLAHCERLVRHCTRDRLRAPIRPAGYPSPPRDAWVPGWNAASPFSVTGAT